VSTNVAHLEAVGVLERWQLVGHLPWGGFIAGGWGMHVECLVRPLMIERCTEVGELSLLGTKISPRRSDSVGFQRAMQALMTAILVRFARCNELRQDTQAHPPCRQLGQPGEGVGGERHTVVGADALWQAECFEHTREDRLGLLHTGGGEGFAPEQEAAVAISNSQRLAVAAVPGLEVPFGVGALHLVGCNNVAGGLARVPDGAALAPPGHRMVAAEDVTAGRAGWPGPAGMACAEDRHKLLRAPGWMPAPCVEDRRHHVFRRGRGEVLGRRDRSSRPCGPCVRERSIHVDAVLRLTP
jgi:hypothetical protein